MHRRLFVLALLLLAACAPQAVPTPVPSVAAAASDTPAALPPSAVPASPTAPPTPTFTPTVTELPALPGTPGPDLTLTPQPGLIIRGYVRLADGTGLPDVSICRNFASYPGTVVAKTDASGYFESQFASIPGDEMVGVWPMAAGYTFKPDHYRWRHYFGSEDRSLEFIAILSQGTAAPPFPCP